MAAFCHSAVGMPPQDNNLAMRKANGTVVKLMRSPHAGRLYYQASVPTIFVKMEDSNLVLPIVVSKSLSFLSGLHCYVFDHACDLIGVFPFLA